MMKGVVVVFWLYVWKMVPCTAFAPKRLCLPQEGTDVSTSHVLLHIHVQVMAMRWFYVLVCLYRIWSLSSSIQQVSMAQVY